MGNKIILTYCSNDCSICLNSLKETNLVVVLGCGHVFDHNCIENWLKLNENCPLCRKEVKLFIQSEFKKVQNKGKIKINYFTAKTIGQKLREKRLENERDLLRQSIEELEKQIIEAGMIPKVPETLYPKNYKYCSFWN